MTWHELQLQRQLADLKRMRNAGEKWLNSLTGIIKTEDDAIFVMKEQKRLSIINQQYRDTQYRLDTYKKRTKQYE